MEGMAAAPQAPPAAEPQLKAGAIGFLVWWYRAYDNLPGLTGFSRRFGRGWAVGAGCP